MSIGVLILTGGASRRMGADKAALDWEGLTAVERVWTLATSIATGPIFTVGRLDYGFPSIQGEQPGGGPAAGVLAAAPQLAAQGASFALVLAVDAPTLTSKDLAPLVRHRSSAAYAGMHLPAFFHIADLPAQSGFNWPMRDLLEHAGAARLPVPAGASARLRGANTPAERQALLEQTFLEEQP